MVVMMSDAMEVTFVYCNDTQRKKWPLLTVDVWERQNTIVCLASCRHENFTASLRTQFFIFFLQKYASFADARVNWRTGESDVMRVTFAFDIKDSELISMNFAHLVVRWLYLYRRVCLCVCVCIVYAEGLSLFTCTFSEFSFLCESFL